MVPLDLHRCCLEPVNAPVRGKRLCSCEVKDLEIPGWLPNSNHKYSYKRKIGQKQKQCDTEARSYTAGFEDRGREQSQGMQGMWL